MAVIVHIMICLNVTSNILNAYQHFWGICCLCLQVQSVFGLKSVELYRQGPQERRRKQPSPGQWDQCIGKWPLQGHNTVAGRKCNCEKRWSFSWTLHIGSGKWEGSLFFLRHPSGSALSQKESFFRVLIRGFHNLLKDFPSSLFMLLGWSSISVTSLLSWSQCLYFLTRML